MNIIVRSHTGAYHFRPDSTLSKESRDLYLPKTIEYIDLVPAFSAKIGKAAKSVSPKYVERYVSGYAFGLVVYAESREQSIYSDTLRITLDNTVYIADNIENIHKIDKLLLELNIDKNLYSYDIDFFSIIKSTHDFIVKVSAHSSLKSGDLLFIELGNKRKATENSLIVLTDNNRPIFHFRTI